MMPSLSYSDMKSALISSVEAGEFDDLIREALPTDPKEQEALRRYLQQRVNGA
jgi:hypothetical protein